jgi:hypothetical protein
MRSQRLKNRPSGRRFNRLRQGGRGRRTRLAGATNSRVVTNFIDQPLPVASDMVTSRRFQVNVTATGTGAFTISPKALIDALPGTSTVWDKVQFHKFDLFSAGGLTTTAFYPSLTVTVTNPSSGYFGDVPTGYADSVGSTRRAHVGIIMNELFKETWIDSTDTSPLLTVVCSDGTNSAALIQFVCILRSTAGTIPGVPATSVTIAGQSHRTGNTLLD